MAPQRTLPKPTASVIADNHIAIDLPLGPILRKKDSLDRNFLLV
jgi:hypothetical protein